MPIIGTCFRYSFKQPELSCRKRYSSRTCRAFCRRTVEPLPSQPAIANWTAFDEDIPPLPQKLSPAQAARLAEIFDYLHRGLTSSVENIDANEDGTEIKLGFAEWQTIQAVQMLLARYGRNVAEPDSKL